MTGKHSAKLKTVLNHFGARTHKQLLTRKDNHIIGFNVKHGYKIRLLAKIYKWNESNLKRSLKNVKSYVLSQWQQITVMKDAYPFWMFYILRQNRIGKQAMA